MHWNDWNWWRQTPVRAICGVCLLLALLVLGALFVIYVVLPLVVPALTIIILAAIIVGVVRNRFWPRRGNGH